MMVLSQDLPIVLTLFGAAVAAIIAGSLLLPRGQIMVSEASSHAVLPGMVLGFLLSGEHGWLMLIGAIAVISLFLGLTSWLRRRHRLGASVEIAALFPLFFGAGVILLSLSGLDDTAAIDLDHILFGSLELILWLDVLSPADLLRPGAWAAAPDRWSRTDRGRAGAASGARGLPTAEPQPDGRAGLRPHVARGEPWPAGARNCPRCNRQRGLPAHGRGCGRRRPVRRTDHRGVEPRASTLASVADRGVITLLGLGLSYVLSAAFISSGSRRGSPAVRLPRGAGDRCATGHWRKGGQAATRVKRQLRFDQPHRAETALNLIPEGSRPGSGSQPDAREAVCLHNPGRQIVQPLALIFKKLIVDAASFCPGRLGNRVSMARSSAADRTSGRRATGSSSCSLKAPKMLR